MEPSAYEIIAIIVAVVLLVLIPLSVSFFLSIKDFRRELKELNFEIARNTGETRKHYKKRKRRLFLALLPFVRY